MAEKETSQGSAAKYAQRNDPKRNHERLRNAELAQLGKNVGRLRSRNFITGLTIGGIVLGIYGYTFYSVSQEKFLDELENEAKVARANYPKTSAN